MLHISNWQKMYVFLIELIFNYKVNSLKFLVFLMCLVGYLRLKLLFLVTFPNAQAIYIRFRVS
jgi:hypothetical protein